MNHLPVDFKVDRSNMTDTEWDLRVQLAAAYRLVDYFGWTELIYGHLTARVPGPEPHFLINPYGLNYDEITASNLVKIDVDGSEADVIGGSLNVIRGAEEIYFEENGSEADQTFLKIILDLGFKIKHSEPCLIGGKKSETAKNLILEKSKSRQIRSENDIEEI